MTAHVLFLGVSGAVKPTSLYLVSPRVSELAIHIDIRSCEVPGYSTTILFRPNEGGHMDDHTIMASSLVPMPDAATTSGERNILSGYAILASIATLLIYCSLQAVARRLSKCLVRRRSVASQTEPWFQKQWFAEASATLKTYCINHGLPSHGLKGELVERCVQHEQLCVP